MKKTLTAILCLALAAAMLCGLCACSGSDGGNGKSKDKNPVVATVGTAEFSLYEYSFYYSQYLMYKNYVEDYERFIKDLLTERGVMLTKAKELGVTLTAEEEEICDQDARRQFSGESYDDYFFSDAAEELEVIIKVLREDYIIDKLHEKVTSEVDVDRAAVEAYTEENTPKEKEKYETNVNAFANAFNSYITGSGAVPLYTPKNMFLVKHCLIQFTNYSQVSDSEPGAFSSEDQAKVDEITGRLASGISLDEFIESYVMNGAYNDDWVFIPTEDDGTIETNPQLGYREHGYIMNEELIMWYYEGFGAAACSLYYGEDWVLPDNGFGYEGGYGYTAAERYSVEYFMTSDGHKIAKVQANVTGGGVHFIWISEVLPEGEVTVGDENSPEYRSIEKVLLSDMQYRYFNEKRDQWKTEVKASFKDGIIGDYIKSLSEGSTAQPVH